MTNRICLVDNRISEYNVFMNSDLPNVHSILIDINTTCVTDIMDAIQNLQFPSIDSIAYIAHASFGETDILHDLKINISDLSTIAPLSDFLTYMKSNYGLAYFDFLGCGLAANDEWLQVFSSLHDKSNVDIRASTGDTGNLNAGGDWILELGNVDAQALYFNSNIANFTELLVSLPNIENFNSMGTVPTTTSDADWYVYYNSYTAQPLTTQTTPIYPVLNTALATGNKIIQYYVRDKTGTFASTGAIITPTDSTAYLVSPIFTINTGTQYITLTFDFARNSSFNNSPDCINIGLIENSSLSNYASISSTNILSPILTRYLFGSISKAVFYNYSITFKVINTGNKDYNMYVKFTSKTGQSMYLDNLVISTANSTTITGLSTTIPTPLISIYGVNSFEYTGTAQGPSDFVNTGTGTTYSNITYIGISPTTYNSSSTKPTNVGTYAVNVTLEANGSYSSNTVTLNFSITQASPTVSITGATSFVYNGASQGPSSATNTGTGSSYSWTYVGRGSTTYSSSSTKPINVGTYTATATITANGNYSSSSTPIDFSITQASPTVSITGATSFVYNGASQGPSSATNTGTGSSYSWAYAGRGSTTYTSSSTAPINVGDYTATATITANGNYSSSSTPIDFSITKAPLEVIETTPNSKVFDGNTSITLLASNYSFSGMMASESAPTLSIAGTWVFASQNAGTSIAISGGTFTTTNANYSVTPCSLTGSIYSYADIKSLPLITRRKFIDTPILINDITYMIKVPDDNNNISIDGTSTYNYISFDDNVDVNFDGIILRSNSSTSKVSRKIGNDYFNTSSIVKIKNNHYAMSYGSIKLKFLYGALSSGDPYITNFAGEKYKMPSATRIYRLYDDNETFINASISQLTQEEKSNITSYFAKNNLSDEQLNGYFYDTFYIYSNERSGTFNRNLDYVGDLEQLPQENISIDINSNHTNFECPIQGNSTFQSKTISLSFKNQTIIELRKYSNPQILNGIEVLTNTTKSTGVLNSNLNPKNFRLKNITNINPIKLSPKEKKYNFNAAENWIFKKLN